MSDKMQRYDDVNSAIDLDNDELYDYVLEREALKKLDNVVPPNCRGEHKENANAYANAYDNDQTEDFTNINKWWNRKSKQQKHWMKLCFWLVIIIALCYYFYKQCNNKSYENLERGSYVVRLSH